MKKENIIFLIKELKKREYLENGHFTFHIKGQELGESHSNQFLVKNIDIDGIQEKLNHIEFDGYNITINLEQGIHRNCDYDENWKSVDFTFWSGIDGKHDKQIDTDIFGKFEYTTLSSTRESFGIRERFWEYSEKDGRPYRIDNNYFRYDSVGITIDGLIELDILLDKQYQEKKLIYDKIKCNGDNN